MIKYTATNTGMLARVKNIKTGEKFYISTAIDPYGVYETAVFKAPNVFIAIFKPFTSMSIFVVNSTTLEAAKKKHIRTAELFEQLNPKELIRQYEKVGSIGMQNFLEKKNGITISSTQNFDKPTKQAQLLHSLLLDLKSRLTTEIAASISRDFNVSLHEATDKISVFITGLSIHMIHGFIANDPLIGKEVSEKFLKNIGKSTEDINFIHKKYGSTDTDSKSEFKKDLNEYIGVPSDDPRSEFYYLRIKTACTTAIETTIKKIDSVKLKNGAWDLN